MINVIGALSEIIEDWNNENKCDFCWEFTFPIRESDLNEYQQKSDECCVIVAVTDYRVVPQFTYNTSTGLRTNASESHYFNLHFLIKDDVGLNVYNEISNHSILESKWETILKPLADCVVGEPIDFCDKLGTDLETLNWTATPKIDWLDMNYTGWTINAQLRRSNI